MKFTNLTISNFLAIGEADLRLDGLGLVSIAGETDDPSADSNGAGKSSIGDALAWCFWGSTARGLSGDDVVNTAAGKGAMVQVTVDDDGDVYRVTRYRKYPKHKNALVLERLENGTWTDITKGTTALTQRQIERLLGCSEDVYNAAVYSGQENMPDIPQMTDKQLKLLVEQAAGVDVLAGAYDIARERLRDRAQTRAEAQIALDRATERHEDAMRSVERLSEQATQWEGDQKKKISDLRDRTITAKADFEQAKDELDPADEAQLRQAISDCQAKIAAVNAERQREQVLLGDLSQAQQALSQAQRNLAGAEQAVTGAQRQVADAEAHLENVKGGVGKPCKTCSRPLEADHLEAAITRANDDLALRQQRLSDAEASVASIRGNVVVAEKLVRGAQQSLDQHRASMTDVSEEADRLKSLQRELQIIDQQKNEIERLRIAAVNMGEQWKREAAAANPFKPMIEQTEKELIGRAAAIQAAEKAAIEASQEEKYAAAVVEVFAPAGVRAHRLDEATPFLNERTAHYLGSLADGKIEAFWTTLTETKGKQLLREQFSVTVEKEGSAPSFKALSGGEKRKVRLACALALQDLVATRASKNVQLWIGDEIDDALDPAGLERLMGVLEEKARDRGTVLVISHNDIADFARKTILVKKVNDRATVTVQ